MDAGTGQVRGSIVEKLSPRQREIMEMVAKGLTERQIARELGIAARTVKYHKATARSRTGCQSSVELAVKFVLEVRGL